MKLAPIMKLTGKAIVSSIIKFTLALFELFWIPISKDINKEVLNVKLKIIFLKQYSILI